MGGTANTQGRETRRHASRGFGRRVCPSERVRHLGGGATPAAPVPAAPPVAVGSTVKVPFAYVNYLSSTGGEASAEGLLRWPKKEDPAGKVIAGIVVVKGDLMELAGQPIVAARLMMPVKEGHTKTPTKIGAVVLKDPPPAGKAFGEDAFAAIAGTCVIPQQNEPPYKPAKPFAIDVTASVKQAVAASTSFYGFAVRVVPDRAVDTGLTGKCRVSAQDPITVEIDVAK